MLLDYFLDNKNIIIIIYNYKISGDWCNWNELPCNTLKLQGSSLAIPYFYLFLEFGKASAPLKI